MTYLTGLGEHLETLDDVILRTKNFFDEDPQAQYEVSIGTDAQCYSRVTKYVTAIVIYKIHNGGILFRQNVYVKGRRPELHEKLIRETTLTIEVAELFIPKLKKLMKEFGYNIINVYADGDVSSTDGQSSSMKTAVEGMFKSYGLKPRVKPNAFAASCVADYYC